VISLLEAEHPDVETLAHEVVIELKQRWFSEDHYVVLLYETPTLKMSSPGLI